jgi:hypothetical protein
MILKINFIKRINGDVEVKKVKKVKIESIKPRFNWSIRHSSYVKIYDEFHYKHYSIGTGHQKVYFFNTEITYIYYDKMEYEELVKITQPFIRDIKIKEILS